MGRWTKPIALGIAATVGVLAAGCANTGPIAHTRPPAKSGPGPSAPAGELSSGVSLLVGLGALNSNVNDSYVTYGAAFVSTKESVVEIPVPVGGTVSHLRVNVTKAPGAGTSWTLTADKNGQPTALSCSISGATKSCRDSSRITVVAGDTLDLDVKPFGGPALVNVRWSVALTG